MVVGVKSGGPAKANIAALEIQTFDAFLEAYEVHYQPRYGQGGIDPAPSLCNCPCR